MNFRRILSKSSLKSHSSSAAGKSATHSDVVPRLQGEIEVLKQTVESLKISLESRDAAIGTLAREKEKIYVELKSIQRTNRNLHQQLMDERDMHSKEKDYLIEEIKRLSKSDVYDGNIKRENNVVETSTSCSLKDELKAKDEVIYNICKKYLKVKSSKQLLQRKLEKLQAKSQKMCEDVVTLLQQNRLGLDHLLNKMIKASVTPASCKQYLKLLKVNSILHYENTQLKVRLSLKELSEERDEGMIENDRSTSVKLAKSDGKLHVTKVKFTRKNPTLRSPQAKLHRKREYETKFNNLHAKLSPHFRRKKRYHSDPCLVGCY